MPWKKPTFLQFESSFRPSMLYNNLAYDGLDRFAIIDGSTVKISRRTWNMYYNWDSIIEYEDGREVMQTFWWKVPSRASKLLVIATSQSDETPASIEVWDIGSLGSNSKIYEFVTGVSSEGNRVDFVRGLCAVELNHSNEQATKQYSVLFAGTSIGHILGISASELGYFEHCTVVKELHSPITALAADVKGAPRVAACDEDGNCVALEFYHEFLDVIQKKTLYATRLPDRRDFYTTCAYRGDSIVTGHRSGLLSFHHVEDEGVFAEVVASTGSVTCLAVMPTADCVIAGGEDCRASMFEFPRPAWRLTAKDRKSSALFYSLCVNSKVVGCAFVNLKDEKSLNFAVTLWEQPYIVQYEHELADGDHNAPIWNTMD
mmetsp:Transcript_6288/g.18979  ORF Transcript_6288/g.18979 Transcript_6288/m.18979 type:complete len:374 (-) Transcript_6288:359-1480(-)|eukprot:CAMPEP_0198735654 /NCGR_PEP_ID=MMETSP1475-20131203/61162_1 /TAXON_ID= ORGANISM="Unidentified sp., Strain CCMP1999" /NCGR_SAMPLE_ID=MMETSP1475 /ASSEMBLY_ACC=CAM_ASM_001111 /LENGTH=373 /DNA_ID=CAMNT_0044499351 /DNA_START=174 /DNA_END=1295 /DNA_ORIENTATION=+